MVETLVEFREAIKDEEKMLEEVMRAVDFADAYGKVIHTEILDVGDWYTTYFEVFEVEFPDGKALFGVEYMVGNTEAQDNDAVAEYDEIYEVEKKEVIKHEYVAV